MTFGQTIPARVSVAYSEYDTNPVAVCCVWQQGHPPICTLWGTQWDHYSDTATTYHIPKQIRLGKNTAFTRDEKDITTHVYQFLGRWNDCD